MLYSHGRECKIKADGLKMAVDFRLLEGDQLIDMINNLVSNRDIKVKKEWRLDAHRIDKLTNKRSYVYIHHALNTLFISDGNSGNLYRKGYRQKKSWMDLNSNNLKLTYMHRNKRGRKKAKNETN